MLSNPSDNANANMNLNVNMNMNIDSEDSTWASTRQPLPHIVMIVLDDLGSHDLGLHGTGIHTPTIDGFVTTTATGTQGANDVNVNVNAKGIYLDDYYVLPYCSPTRAALLSGMYPLRTGVHNVIEPISTAGLPLNIETLPEMLKRATPTMRDNDDDNADDNGDDSNEKEPTTQPPPPPPQQQQQPSYQTHAVGKWHVGHSAWEQTPTFRGFDSFFGFYQGGQDYFTHSSLGGVDLHFDRSPFCGEGCSKIVDEKGNYSTHVFTREAIKVVHQHANANSNANANPLFLYLAYQAVHCPNEVPYEYEARYANRTDWTHKRKSYAGMLTAADEGIGNLTKALKEAGLWENTLVVLTTDNGGPTTVGCAQGSSNYPKRGGKCSLWEGGTTGDALLAGPALQHLLSSRSAVASATNTATNTATATTSSSETTKTEGGEASTRDDTNNSMQFPRRFRHLFHVVDWFPTLAEWVGVVPLNQTVLDGVSQAEALAFGGNGPPARTELFGGYAYWKDETTHSWWGPSIRHKNWKLVRGASGGPDANDPMPPGTGEIVPPGDNINEHAVLPETTNSTTTTTTTAAVAITATTKSKYLLFDLKTDPLEETDLSAAYPEILEKMVYRLKLYRKSFVYPQINDDSGCPFPGLVNTTTVGPAWCVACVLFCVST